MSDLVRQSLERTLQASSLKQLVTERRRKRDTFLLLDTSGSMDQAVEYGLSTRRIDALKTLVADLKRDLSCPMVAFSDAASLIDALPEPQGGTDLAGAIDFCRLQHAVHLIVISDGEPDDGPAALAAATRFGGIIDAFYVGPDGGKGGTFLAQLCVAAHGRYQAVSLAAQQQIANTIRGYLTEAFDE